jgi:superfamily II DNA/RNA helicase
VFCNRRSAAEWLARRLDAAGWPAAHLSAALPQPERMAAIEAVRTFRARIVVCTDVMARGVDLERINLVISLDLPPDAATYVHRVGRTGRFGARGLSVALLSSAELAELQGYLDMTRGGALHMC